MSLNHEVIYDSEKSRWISIEEVKDIFRHKELIYQLVRRDIITRYKRSYLGLLWSILNPLGTMIILTIVFSRFFNMRGVYPVYIITGLVAWNFFSQTLQFSLNTTLKGSDLYKKIYMPRTAFVISVVGGGLINFMFALVPMLLIFLVTKVSIQPSIFLLPAAILLLVMFTLGLSLLLSSTAVFFPDVAEFFPVLITAWLYLTPIIYPEELLQDIFYGLVLTLNPIYHLIKIFRDVVYGGIVPPWNEWLVATGIAAAMLVIGWKVFMSKSKYFGYYE